MPDSSPALRRVLVLGSACLAAALALTVVAALVSAATAITGLVIIMWLAVWRIVRSNRT